MEDLEERAKKAGIQIAVRTNFINKPANAVANLKVCVRDGSMLDFRNRFDVGTILLKHRDIVLVRLDFRQNAQLFARTGFITEHKCHQK